MVLALLIIVTGGSLFMVTEMEERMSSRQKSRGQKQTRQAKQDAPDKLVLQTEAIGTKPVEDVASSAEETSGEVPEQGTEESQEVESEAEDSGVPDRSDFAVTPGRTVGTYEQSAEKVVYLTLDDGPSNLTQAVLDILDKYDVKATFFVTGAMPEYQHMIKVAYDKGHTIGLHTYSHDYATVYSSPQAYFQDLQAVGEMVKAQIGYVPSFIRFPGGASNTISANYSYGIMTALTQQVQAQGYQYYDWNCSSGDGSVRNADELTAQATSCHENNIMLLSHDSSAKQTTVDALPRIIEYYQGQGYEFRAIDTTSYVAHHGVSN